MPLPSQRRELVPAGDPDTFSILTICTGNLCRSPLAEQLLRDRLRHVMPDARITVQSAGTAAVNGQPMDRAAAREAKRLGVTNADRHTALRLRDDHVATADLVLALAREHRAAAVHLTPLAVGRAFTLLEFTSVVRALEPSTLLTRSETRSAETKLRAVVAEAHSMRGVVAARGAHESDVMDPHGRDGAVHRATADVIDTTVSQLCDLLGSLVHNAA